MPELDSSPQFERITPLTPDSSGASIEGKSQNSPAVGPDGVGGTQILIALAFILLLGITAIVGLPKLLALGDTSSPPPETAPSENAAIVPGAEKIAADKPEAPRPIWDEPELLRARASSQELRTRFDAQLLQLQASHVDVWAPKALAAARSTAADAERKFSTKDFPASKAAFESATRQAQTLIDQIPVRLKAALDEGFAGIENGDKVIAQQSFALALKLDADNERAKRGMARLENFDQLQSKLQTGRRLEQINDLPGALAAYREALKLDAQSSEAADGVARIKAYQSNVEFQRVMGLAIEALDLGRLDAAATQLARARKMRPDDGGVLQASSRLKSARKERELAILQAESEAQVKGENWAGALASYEAAMKIDPGIGFAAEGIGKARQRAALAQKLQDLLNRPTRLQSEAVRSEAERMLAEAALISDGGPILQQQINGVRRAIATATAPIEVPLRSDNLTEVTIYRVGKQGKFLDKKISLKPGNYVAIGVRAGYRDVRHDFKVVPGMAPIDIRCREPL